MGQSCGKTLDAVGDASSVCHLWLDPLIDYEDLKKLAKEEKEHELRDLSKAAGRDEEKSSEEHRCAKIKPYQTHSSNHRSGVNNRGNHVELARVHVFTQKRACPLSKLPGRS
eukprot:m.157243 g.157243  ORF g.157243 m.157243 type:complete len:112 (+) comp38707_c0_seq9:1071-1406(+)